MANTPRKAIEIAKEMISTGIVYAYGFKYEKITINKINQLAAMYPSTYSTNIKNQVINKIGKIGIDCSGFVCRALGISNIGSSQIKAKMIHLYKVSDQSKLMDGMVIWRNGHIALIEVDDSGIAWILEAKGTSYDLTRTKYDVRGKSFTYYGELSGIDYSSARKIGQVSGGQTVSKGIIRDLIDISHHNTIDLAKTASKYKDVIIRVGYRAYATGALTIDNKFVNHAKVALENGMRMGVYFYDQSINEAEATKQADWVAGLIKSLPISYPVYIDSEYSNSKHNGRADGISKTQRTKNIIAFCERIKQLGYISGVYASDSWFKSMVDFEKLKSYEIWCARYSSNAPTISKYGIWQYGSIAVPGSATPIDINHLYIDYSSNNSENNDSNSFPSIYFCTVAASSLYVRNMPSMTGKKLGTLKNGTSVNIYELKNGWGKISKTEDKWCSYQYIKPTLAKVANCTLLNCRPTPDSKTVNFVLKNNTVINVLCQDRKSSWYYIETGGKVGFVSNKYVSI